MVDLLVNQPGIKQTYDEALGVTYEAARENADEALHQIVERFGQLTDRFEVIVVVGSDYADVATGTELSFNAKIAANLGSPVVLVVHGRERTPEQIRAAADSALAELRANHAQTVAVIANRVEADGRGGDPDGAGRAARPGRRRRSRRTRCCPRRPSAPWSRRPTAELVLGSEAWMDRESLGLIVAAMSLPNVLDRLRPDVTVIAPSDRTDLIPGLMLAHQSGTFPTLAGILLTGGYEIPETIRRLSEGVQQDLPIALTDLGTFTTAERLMRVRGPMTTKSMNKIETRPADLRRAGRPGGAAGRDRRVGVGGAYAADVRVPADGAGPRRPQAHRAAGEPGRPDPRGGGDPAAARRGRPDPARARRPRSGPGPRPSGLTWTRPRSSRRSTRSWSSGSPRRTPKARAHKGMTVEKAREIVTDISYFGTMMVHLGLADGMVSGAVNTTAHTIRPALEFVKTKPGVNTVSSVFLMCLADRVLVYGDCAVIPEPTTEQLADIAISSAETARQFGIEPRVAMLSYSTGTSGSGAEVEKVRAATALVAERAPDLALEGPIQYDAAIDPDVARTKLPDSAVAGRATVFIFPDLNTGNNTYKAVQRSAHAVADRAGAAGPAQAGERPVPGGAGGRHREHRGHHRGAGPGGGGS